MKIISIVILVFLLNGCVSNAKYPSDWAKPGSKETHSCLSWSGSFYNHGENTLKNGESLLALIFAQPTTSNSNADLVKLNIDIEKGSIDVEMYENGKIVTRLTLNEKKSEFHCENGKIAINRNKFVSDGGAIGKEWVGYTLHLTSEALVIEKKNGVVGALFFIPIIGQESNWLRFKKI